jgi:hypothetical protein
MKRKGKRRLRSTRGRFISRSRVAPSAKRWRFDPFWNLAVPTAAFFLLRRWGVTAALINQVAPEEVLPAWITGGAAEAAEAQARAPAPPGYQVPTPPAAPVQIQIGPGSIGGTKRWLPPGSAVTVYPCPAGYARGKMADDGTPWPASPGPGWVQDSSAGLGSCRKA